MSAFIERTCQQCGAKFMTYPAWIRKGGGKYCSRACSDMGQTGTGRCERKDGYVSIKMPDHPRANKWGFVYEHILVAEEILGRPLKDNEVVHHKNGNPSDNNHQNLFVCEGARGHMQQHALERIIHFGGNPEKDKICHNCKKVLPKSSFSTSSSRGKKCLASACRECAAKYQRARREAC